MRLTAVTPIRLKRALALHVTPQEENEPSMVTNGFNECQCRWFVLERLLQLVCAFGLSPKFSTPVEKTVEIR
jgi:hypothetical protein